MLNLIPLSDAELSSHVSHIIGSLPCRLSGWQASGECVLKEALLRAGNVARKYGCRNVSPFCTHDLSNAKIGAEAIALSRELVARYPRTTFSNCRPRMLYARAATLRQTRSDQNISPRDHQEAFRISSHSRDDPPVGQGMTCQTSYLSILRSPLSTGQAARATEEFLHLR